MALYRPTALQALLQQLSTGPKKSLSQNFLIDGNILRKTVASAQIAPGDLVLEIGPGPGALTECLLAAGAQVVAVEKDALLAKALKNLPGADGHLEVFCQDILEFPLEKELSERLQGGHRRAKVVANLPYHLTSPILGLLLPQHQWIQSVHVMVQEEVARRLTGQAGTKNYSALTVFTQLYGGASYSFGVSRNCFMPAPKVDSAVVAFTLQPPPSDLDAAAFLIFVHRAFGQRRKMLRSALAPLWERSSTEAALTTLQIPTTIRAEALTYPQLLALYRQLIK